VISSDKLPYLSPTEPRAFLAPRHPLLLPVRIMPQG
jgi:hypothetical protein